MTQLLTSAQMRAIEAAAIAGGTVSETGLMQRAGQEVVAAILDRWPALRAYPGRALVLCGPGNNGGDGHVVARLLSEQGWQVSVAEMGAPRGLPPAAAAQRAALPDPVARGGLDLTAQGLASVDLVIDALFGTGLARPVGADVAGALARVADARPGLKLVAVDILSGYSADSGALLAAPDSLYPAHLVPDLTVTFEAPRLGHHIGDFAALNGPLAVRSIGLADLLGRLGPGLDGPVTLTDAGLAQSLGKSRPAGTHKYSFGHALVIGGGADRAGAARLAARAALRVGAGLVTLGLPEGALSGPLPDAIMRKTVRDAAGLEEILADRRISALCLGPGLGQSDARAALLAAALADGRPLVLDADAVTLLAQRPELRARLHGMCVLTPHGGEFARLFPDLAAQLGGRTLSKVEAARMAAKAAGCTVLLKGADSVIADQTGRAAVNSAHGDRAAPWLATAGSGDVLAGLAAGLLARGMAPFEAAQCAAWLHVEAARHFGPGLIADDLPEALPAVFRSLNL